MRLQHKTAVVTGAAQGIGLAIAERFVAEGAKVLLADLNRDALVQVAQRLKMPFCAVDVSQAQDVDRMIADAKSELGGIDIMVSNAGVVNKPTEFLDLDVEEFDRVLKVNLRSQFLCGQAAARVMVAAGTKGVIINMSSVNARLAIPSLVPYVISKAGATQLTNVMSIALAKHGIRVNAIGPGTILTELARASTFSDAEARHRVLSRTPLGRCGDPAEMGGIAVFLASEDSSYITGQTIYADGGRMGLNYMVDVPGSD